MFRKIFYLLKIIEPECKSAAIYHIKSACAEIYELPWCLRNIDTEFCDYGGCICDDIYFIIFNKFYDPQLTLINLKKMTDGLPYGYLGIIAAMQFAPALIAAVLIGMTLLGMYLGYWINILGGVAFYFLASVWFLKRRLKFIDKSQFLKAGTQKWPKPKEL